MPSEFEELDDAVIAEGGMGVRTSNDYDNLWDSLEKAREEQTSLRCMVIDAVRGGLSVDMGVRGFIPKSEIATRNVHNLARFIGQSLQVQVVEADRETGRVVLSHKRVAEEKRKARREATLASLEKGQQVKGVVRRITDFGAFVDIGGIDGLLHVSDIAWEVVKHPSDVLKEGDHIEVLVLKIENNGERISLGLKQLQEDPWVAARRDLREGSLVEATITGVATAGAYAKVADGIEGFIPIRELSERRIDNAESAVQVGQTMTVKVLEFIIRDRRLTLSVRQAVRDKERQDLHSYMDRQKSEYATPTLGDLFGDVFNKLKQDK